ncbi:2-hydroxyacid dehydrogenase [Salinispora vitiensis]|uniref:2-hydroxyacid dehydrogenase n=1 Tax=Salinispora vitiensis TaxID=999544 RepID=UPI0003683112|nr:2-hydroxyacid dehydrogenase [Salinispora vitiensis]
MKVWIPHEDGTSLLGDLPAGVTVEVAEPDRLPSPVTDVRFWVPPFLAEADTTDLLRELPDLEVVQLLTAGADAWAGRMPPGVTLCDARGVHDQATSEWVVAAILAHLRSFPTLVRAQDRREWAYREVAPTDELAGKRVLIVGAGSIGTALEARLAPFEVRLTRVARTARPGVHAVAELPRLLPEADVVVLLVPLTEQTRGLVDEGFLAAMCDGALLVNAARGPVAQTEALVAELGTGRISAVLDVTDPEPLPADNPLWAMPNVLLTPHVAGSVQGLLPRAYRLVGDQIRRCAAGEPPTNVVVAGY